MVTVMEVAVCGQGAVSERPVLVTHDCAAAADWWVKDARLSWQARGVACFLADHSPRHVTVAELTAASPAGVQAVRSALRELAAAGVVAQERVRDEHGRAVCTGWRLQPEPDP